MNFYPTINTNILKKGNNLTFLQLGKLEKVVFGKRHGLGEAYLKYGNMSLLEFAQKQFHVSENMLIDEKRKKEVIQVIKDETAKRLSPEIAERIEKQLEREYLALTADHFGPLNDPRYLSGELLSYAVTQYKTIPTDLLVLSCALVSFDNPSFPRGHEFHTLQNGVPTMNQLVFFPRKVRPLIVSGYPSYQQENITSLKERVDLYIREGVLSKSLAEKLNGIIDDVYVDPALFDLQTYSEQITKTNFKLWKKMVGDDEKSPNLIFLEQEFIVNTLILKHHLYTDSLINRILFDTTIYDSFVKNMDGVNRAFSLKDKSGTYLFWALPKGQKYRQQLWKEGNQLVSADGTYRVDLTPDAIANAIKEKELIPSALLDFIVLAFYYGMSLLGGSRQTTYLPDMKEAFMRFLNEIGDTENSNLVKSIPADKFSVVISGLAFLTDKNKDLIPATALDLLLYGDTKFTDTIKYMAQTATLQQVIARILPDVYAGEIPEAEQDEKLKNITIKDIDALTNFEKIVVSSGYIE